MKTHKHSRVLMLTLATLAVILGVLLPTKLAYASEEPMDEEPTNEGFTGELRSSEQSSYDVYIPNDAPEGYGVVKVVENDSQNDLPFSAVEGSTVTLVAIPDQGCKLMTTDFILREGDITDVTYIEGQTDDGYKTFTFTMPNGLVAVRATFFETNPIPLWVGGVRVSHKNKGNVLGDDNASVSFDDQTNTLTLKDANIGTTDADKMSHWKDKQLYQSLQVDPGTTNIYSVLLGTLTIELEGNNTITSAADTCIQVINVTADGDGGTDLRITGTGSLTSSDKNVQGISVWRDLLIDLDEGGAIDVSASSEGSNDARGICSQTGIVTINTGSVTARGDKNGIAAFERVNINGGIVTAYAGDNEQPIEVFMGDSEPGFDSATNIISVAATHEVTTPAGGWVQGREILYNDGVYSYPRSATGTVVIEPRIARDITIVPADGGEVTSSEEKAYTDDTVTLTIAPDQGEQLKSLTIIDASGANVEYKINDQKTIATFTMPPRAVTVTPLFHDPRVTVDFGEGHEEFVKTYLQAYKEHNPTADMNAFVVSGSKVTYTVPAGTTQQDARAKIVGEAQTFIEEGKRLDKGVYFMEDFALDTIDAYADMAARNVEWDTRYAELVPDGGVTFYALWAQPVGDVSITVNPLACGTEVTIDSLQSGIKYTNPQVEGTLTNERASLDTAYTSNWFQTLDGNLSPFEVKGETDYYAVFSIHSNYGYFFNDMKKSVTVTNDSAATISNAENVSNYGRYVRIVAKVPAVHDWGEWEQTKAPTCTGKGEEKNVCGGCGKEETRDVDALGHDWGDWTQIKAPTCTEKGTEQRACKREGCNEKETRDVAVDPTAHDWGEWTQTKAPTCTTAGTEQRTCKRDKSHTETRDVAVDPAAHDWGEWTQAKAPTCTEKGTEERACKREGCGAKETHVVDALGHDWGEPTYVWADDNSTCTATRTCKRNKDHAEAETAEATSSVTKEPTATEKGERTYAATFTNSAFKQQTKVEAIPAKGEAPEYYYESGENGEWTKGSDKTLAFVIECKNASSSDWNRKFAGIRVDDTSVDTENYDVKFGSVILSLKPGYLETLSVGEHTLTAEFEDGIVSTKFTIKDKSEGKSTTSSTAKGTTGSVKSSSTGGSSSGSTGGSTSTASKTSTPKTGDRSADVVVALIAGAALVCLFGARRIA